MHASASTSTLTSLDLNLTSNQMWSGDEIGFDPNGKYRTTIRLKAFAGAHGRSFRLMTGEHAPFWVTMFFWSR